MNAFFDLMNRLPTQTTIFALVRTMESICDDYEIDLIDLAYMITEDRRKTFALIMRTDNRVHQTREAFSADLLNLCA